MNATPLPPLIKRSLLRPVTALPARVAGVPPGPGVEPLNLNPDALSEHQPPGLGKTGLLLILAFWTIIAVLTSANSLLEPRRGPFAPVAPFAPVILAFASTYMWALVTPPIFWLTNRFTLERSRWPHWLMYIALGLVSSVIIDHLNAVLRHNLYYAVEPLTQQFLSAAAARRFWFMNEFIIYVAVLAAGFAHNYFLRYRVRREETVRLQAEAALLQSQAAQLQAQLADARLSALRAQLNPHFLFNTLHAVSALVERDPRGVRRMIARLSELLRTSLDEAEEQEVPLQRELTFTERYLDIIQIRFQGQLRVDLDVDNDVRNALVPNLVLQPLVENAIKHGVGKLSDGGHIQLSARRSGSRVIISVRDNGPDAAPCIDADAQLPASSTGGGVGLRNTRDRLAALYGPHQSLTLRPADSGGLIAEVSLPYHTHADLRTRAVSSDAAQARVESQPIR